MSEKWNSFRDLRKVETNYSGMCYSYEFAKESGMLPYRYSESYGEVHTVGVREELEITYDADTGILYKISGTVQSGGCKETFDTQFGVFQNDNRGEFGGQMITSSGVCVNGNFREVVNHKKKVYAIDSRNHLGLAHFRLLEFAGAKEYRVLYHTKDFLEDMESCEDLQYGALYDTGEALFIVISGHISQKNKHRGYVACTKILKVKDSQVFELVILKEALCWVKNLIVVENVAYVSMDKMIMRIDLDTGSVEYYTHISDLAELDLLEVSER